MSVKLVKLAIKFFSMYMFSFLKKDKLPDINIAK